jgi:hypothetical protein
MGGCVAGKLPKIILRKGFDLTSKLGLLNPTVFIFIKKKGTKS